MQLPAHTSNSGVRHFQLEAGGFIWCKTSARLSRAYNRESDLGNLFADLHRKEGKAQIGLYPSGGIRRDLDAGDVTIQELLDVWPFLDTVQTVKIPGSLLVEVIEQGLSLDRGIMQVSGIKVSYDLDRPVGSRVLEISVGNKPLNNNDFYTLIAQPLEIK